MFSELIPLHLALLVTVLTMFQTLAIANKQIYIVYMGVHLNRTESGVNWSSKVEDSHHEILAASIGSREKAQDAIFHSYTRHINGFAAYLGEDEAAQLAGHPKVASVFLNRLKYLQTTHSWDFMSLGKNGKIPHNSLWKKAKYGKNVIIGTLDTGVWPESKSFSDRSLGPIPSKWKGICQNDTKDGFSCNRKLIGARYFDKFYLSLSLGAKFGDPLNSARDYDGHGSHTLSTAAGNFVRGANVFGSLKGTAKGGSPNARVASYKVCWPNPHRGAHDGDILDGFSAAIEDGVDILSISLGGDPLDYSVDSLSIGSFHAVKNGILVVMAGGNDGPKQGTVSNIAPWIFTVAASTMDRRLIPSYGLHGDRSNISFSIAHTHSAPVIAGFSSVGPNTVTGGILKPDITAPGVDIIAAYTRARSPSQDVTDTRRTSYAVLSGTSMAAPHVAGIAGLLKKLHPKWSPAAIRSAIMTTATTMDNLKQRIRNDDSTEATPFYYGAGHVRPNLASDPGLVYDLGLTDYLEFLCAIGYDQSKIKLFSSEPYECPRNTSLLNFNYPSITVTNLTGSATVRRKVTNVGRPGIYKAQIRQPEGAVVSVKPRVLKFHKIGKVRHFKLRIKRKMEAGNEKLGGYGFGLLTWTDGHHYVRSPIVVGYNDKTS